MGSPIVRRDELEALRAEIMFALGVHRDEILLAIEHAVGTVEPAEWGDPEDVPFSGDPTVEDVPALVEDPQDPADLTDTALFGSNKEDAPAPRKRKARAGDPAQGDED